MANAPYHLVTSGPFSDEDLDELIPWLEDNTQSKFKVISGFEIRIDTSEGDPAEECRYVWLFESLNDALLFKLTWGGNHAE